MVHIKLMLPSTTSTLPTKSELDMETTKSPTSTDTSLVNMTVFNLTDHTTTCSYLDISSMEITLPIFREILLKHSSGPLTQIKQVSFTNTKQ